MARCFHHCRSNRPRRLVHVISHLLEVIVGQSFVARSPRKTNKVQTLFVASGMLSMRMPFSLLTEILSLLRREQKIGIICKCWTGFIHNFKFSRMRLLQSNNF
jgi:hypothetical protein